ncbi:trypsin-like serine peptidase [Agrilutibacter solisilvae]|uniref:Trypsin-like serine protease n=1 Tax=Agrilutibacter solisilvae TaxID=2763317 RepID=A0A974Y1K8_9GAMM|nr:trypsin-like serine protease [Lysobacter solisilvae]QSX79736.1 trypsin-like serine protease [Lysobacter solisilvae]
MRRANAFGSIATAKRAFGSALLAGCVACSQAASRTNQALTLAPAAAPTAETAEDISFVLADERLPSGRFTLSNGIKVTRSDWPALVFAKFGEASCSGALIGPNILLTAAHCVEDKRGKLREAALKRFGSRYPMACERHPAYVRRPPAKDASAPRGAEDYALCVIDYRGDAPQAIAALRVEVLDTTSTLARKDRVLLTGYGCIDTRIVNRKVVSTASANILRIGDASIARAPTRRLSDGAYVLIDSRGKPTPALCPGDSGGPMFVGASQLDQKGARRIVGVNSAIAPGATGRSDHIVSKISATGTAAFRQWVKDWQGRNANHAKIVCGVTRDAGTFPCRS